MKNFVKELLKMCFSFFLLISIGCAQTEKKINAKDTLDIKDIVECGITSVLKPEDKNIAFDRLFATGPFIKSDTVSRQIIKSANGVTSFKFKPIALKQFNIVVTVLQGGSADSIHILYNGKVDQYVRFSKKVKIKFVGYSLSKEWQMLYFSAKSGSCSYYFSINTIDKKYGKIHITEYDNLVQHNYGEKHL